jgi:hypothetical protein
MTIWDEVKRSVDDISEVAKEVANLLAEKTDEISREGKLKLEIFNVQRQVRGLETKLGRRTYHLWSENPKTLPGKDDEASRYLNTLKELKAKITILQQEIEVHRSAEAEEKAHGEG